MIAFVMMMK